MAQNVTTKGMCVGYRGQPLIRDIDIVIEQGEILTLIGPNGAGKSTILKSIAKQLSLIDGTVYIGKDLLSAMTGQQLSKKMSVVFTGRIRTELMTCEDVVATGRYPYTGRFGFLSPLDHERIREAMEVVQITSIKDRDFTRISDGQKQRVMLARAICQEPEILILDEPTSYLDVKYKLEFLSMLQRLREQKKLTVIMSLHELELAQRVSDKLLCVKGEYVDRFGTPEEIFTPGYIRSLFDMEAGSFDEATCSMELEAPAGEPKVFVIAGGGSGSSVYRRLQRQGIAFSTGILFDNDLDYPVAKALSGKVIHTPGFEPVKSEAVQEAKEEILRCGRVLCCREGFGSLEKANEELVTFARKAQVTVEMETWQK